VPDGLALKAPVPRVGRAVRFDEHGDVDVLYVAEVPLPELTPGQVLVKVRAAGVNPGEIAIRAGAMVSTFPTTFPSGEGTDFAGTVVELGPDSSRFSIGDAVLGWSEWRSSHAEYVIVPEDHIVLKPDALTWEVAGSLFIAGVTAFAAARAIEARNGDTVVVSSAAGGVGSIVVQLLTAQGARVIGIASERNHDWLTSVGVTPVGYAEPALADRIRAIAPDGVDALVDTHGAEYIDLAIELGLPSERINTVAAFQAATRIGAKTDGARVASNAETLARVVELVADGTVAVQIEATYPLDEVREAYTELAKRHSRGKIVLIP
jgi:NADPH:quinone reductase-like Zn-dependent oxidoreductase